VLETYRCERDEEGEKTKESNTQSSMLTCSVVKLMRYCVYIISII